LQNIQRHFFLGINERYDLKLKHDLLVLDADCCGCIVDQVICWTFERVLTGTGTLAWRCDGFVVAGEDVGRETILNLPVDSSTCTMAVKRRLPPHKMAAPTFFDFVNWISGGFKTARNGGIVAPNILRHAHQPVIFCE
jgi:hypothetical protein